MKKLVIILISVFTLNTYTQEKSTDLIDRVLNNLKIEKTKCLTDLIIHQNISKSESIIVIPEIAEKGDGFTTLNSYILIVNNKNGNIKSIFSEKESWSSDALRLENIEVVYQTYQLTKNYETVGILIDYRGSSRVDPYSTKELSLFIRNKENLERVLKDFAVYIFNGETNGMNNGEFVEHKKTIEPVLNLETEFYNLRVVDSIIKKESIDGVEKIIEQSEKTEILQFENGIYRNVL